MKRRFYILILIIIVLLGIFLGSYQLMKPSINKQKDLLSQEEILVLDGENRNLLNKEDIRKLPKEDFEAILDTSTTDPVLKRYTGIQLKNLLKELQIDLNGKKYIILSGADGYSVGYLVEEILKEANVYIGYMEEGEYIKSKDKNGNGPYVAIVTSDQFSNRWCKWLTQIEVK